MEILWEKSCKIIKEKVSPQNYETWIGPVKIASIEGKNINLSVPNKFFRDWLTENYLPVMRESLSGVMGIDASINFTIRDEKINITSEKINKTKPSVKRVYPSLNPHYNFERFVVGLSNQFAHAASIAVAEQPAKNYNPLFIYGGVGLGKTHLLNAIGLHTVSLYQEANVLYLSAEEFMNELINAIRYDKMQRFREKFRSIDSLLIDDIQFIAGKERTQEEFFHTFNTLHDSAKQIVVTSDKFPKDIPNLEGRLRSRFEWGLIADIQTPETETKVAIIKKKAQENNISIPDNVAHYIASKVESNIRELEGYLIRIGAYVSLTGREIDMDLTKGVLEKLLGHEGIKEITIDEIIKAVANKFNVKKTDIKSQKRNKTFVLPRQIVMYLSRKKTNLSYPDIGSEIGGKDHSTVIYANNKIKKLIENDIKTRNLIKEIEDSLQIQT
ncbi:MAG: chromosomal replication initiator protein DnaA [Thermodesulfobacteriota bacterium]|nr:chromosomal replication initiator protein DnaA [Thermodesulfobacteriota bacterium]